MRIHTALTSEQITKFVPSGVSLHVFTEHGSRTHDHAFEIQLSGHGRQSRWVNSGTHGAGYVKAASWDEWGIFLGSLFRADPNARIPRVYEDQDAFTYCTGNRYTRSFTVAHQHANHRWINWNYGSAECKCGAVRRNGGTLPFG